jgi:type IV secretion system protein TrbC
MTRVRKRLRNSVCLRRPLSAAGPLLVDISSGAMITFLLASSAWAAGSGMPWEAPLQRILESVQGPVAKIVAVIIITVTGISLAFGDTSGGFRKMVQVVFGLSIAFAASSFFLSFFSFGGGALI